MHSGSGCEINTKCLWFTKEFSLIALQLNIKLLLKEFQKEELIKDKLLRKASDQEEFTKGLNQIASQLKTNLVQ